MRWQVAAGHLVPCAAVRRGASRIQNDYDQVAKYRGVTTPFDIKAAHTDAFVDPSIKMVDVPEMKF